MFKKFLAYLLIISLLLPAIPVRAEDVEIMVGSGAVTQDNMKISGVNGTAFIDFSDSEAAANKLINHKGYLLKVRDSSKRAIQGYVKAAGAGETEGAELLTNENFEAFTGESADNWTKQSAGDTATKETTLIHGGVNAQKITSAGSSVGVYQNFVWTLGMLYKASEWVYTSKAVFVNIYTNGTIKIQAIPATTYTQISNYYTSPQSVSAKFLVYYGGLAADYIISDDATLKQVLTPSATGVTITSTKGGSTFNFAAQDSAFNYNDASGYTYELWMVNSVVEVASGSIAAGEMLADTTATNAFVAPVGVNLSAFQTGKYIFAAYNTVGGYAAFGYIKGTAPGGETLSAELVDAWTNVPSYGYETFTAGAGNLITQAINTTGHGLAIKPLTSPSGKLFKCVNTYTLNSGTAPNLWLSDLGGNAAGAIVLTKSGTTYSTGLSITGQVVFATGNNVATDFSVSAFSLKQVTDCAATGALIVSAKDGATRAFIYIHPSFSANAESTYKIFYVGD